MSLSTTSTTLPSSSTSSCPPSLPSSPSAAPSTTPLVPPDLALPFSPSLTYPLTSAWTSAPKKFPWILLAPLGGIAGMTSTPTTLPPGLVRDTATCDHAPGAKPRSTTVSPGRKSR
ncbi:hypothetical protein K461DRAFT_279969 [Myriangium duriaei CBS 260.36]|uniref:Uncharacterized protein n=1 Tax=Myriangium duriaei CBS 260.36 TaxID=1168546 RepID=A0A9P4MFK4_9PEZI|nr:hypothetical protein K461DRAFT_279969 [Myriangium duriaei CBS 260.36]